MKNFVIKSPRRIANKIILLVLALELFSLLLWGALSYSGSRDELIQTKSGQLVEIAFSTRNEIGKFFLPILTEAEVISAAIASNANKRNGEIDHFLHSFMNHRSAIEEVVIVDDERRQVNRVSRMLGIARNEVRQFDNDPLVEKAFLGERSIGDITFSEYLEPMVTVATPIKSEDAKDGVILTNINLKWLWDTVQSLRVEQSGYVYVVDEGLELIAHPDPSLVLAGKRLRDTPVDQMLFTDPDHKDLRIYRNFAGDSVAGVSRFDPVHRWWIVVEQPVDEALAPLSRVINRFVMAFILVTILTVVTVVYVSKRMMRPLESLESAIDRLKHGDSSVRVEVPKNTELSSLSESFNEMAVKLNEKTHKLEHQAHHDGLTKLPNRKRLFEYLESKLRESDQITTPYSLLLLDLDRFKEINDSLGHKCGDLLLKELSDRLLGALTERDLVARLGGDEFAVVLDHADTMEKAERTASMIRTVIQEPFELEGMRLLIDASVGIAMFPAHGNNSNLLMRRADVAMYHAKKSGLGVAVYDERYDVNSPQRLALISGLPRAIERSELVLHYQPKIRVSDRALMAVEALVRWDHPEHGLLAPDKFIPIVELGDSIIALTHWVINQALTDCRAWQEQGVDIAVAVNVSTLNIQDEEFVKNLDALISEHGIKPDRLQLEITESVIMADTKRALKTINALDSMGVRISIDDFGTGYSSLAYIKRIPVDELKIDKSFVMDMEQDENDAAIVRSTIDLAHNLGLKVTAEGVEKEGALQLLDVLGCDSAQGFHICRPVSAEDLVSWVPQWRAMNRARLLLEDEDTLDQSAMGQTFR
jgi:diguanylate cyclase (GGDEF)-like protein